MFNTDASVAPGIWLWIRDLSGLGASVGRGDAAFNYRLCGGGTVGYTPAMWGISAVISETTTRLQTKLLFALSIILHSILRILTESRYIDRDFDICLQYGDSATKTRCRKGPFHQLETSRDSQAATEEPG
jgi:hypothetical protein